MFDPCVHDDEGQPKAGNQRFDGWTPLLDDIMFVTKHFIYSVSIMNRFPSVSISVNLSFQLYNESLNSL